MTGTEQPPAVSVMMDVSGGARFLDQALASLAAQTFTDFEIVLLAHGASPQAEATIARWEQREPRLRVIRCAKLTLSQAHNRVAHECRAPLLARLDADDIARPRRLERQVGMFATDPALGFAGSAVEIIDDADRQLSFVRNPLSHEAIAAALANSCPVVHSTLMIRREAFLRAGGYRPGLNISEDYDLYTRLAKVARGGNSSEPLVAYRIHDRSLTGRKALCMAIANEAVRAGLIARARGLAEPFIAGTPSLRRVGEIVALPRTGLRRRVLATARQSSFSRRLLTGWLPLRARGWARDLALRLGLRPAYSALFRAVERLADSRQKRRANPNPQKARGQTT